MTIEVSLEDLLKSVLAVDLSEGGYTIVDEREKLIPYSNLHFVREQRDVRQADIMQKHRLEDQRLINERGKYPAETLVTSEGLGKNGVRVLATHNHIESLRWGVS